MTTTTYRWLRRLVSGGLLILLLGLPGLTKALGVAPAVALAQNTFDCSTVTEISQSECAALVDFYNATGGPGWLDNSNWLQSNTPCSWGGSTFNPRGWVGVRCLFGNVAWLELSANGLRGTLPPSLVDLPAMALLALDGNGLQGALPPALGQLSFLTLLYLNNNRFSGPLPVELGNLINLQSLSLHTNYLTGAIPAQLGALPQLKNLYLHNNRLQGTIPAALGNLTRLEALRLDSNQLSGVIPPEMTNLTALTLLALNNNQLQGELPAGLERLVNLKTLNLSSNQLTGALPPTLGQLTYLQSLSLFGNQFTGELPTEWGQLHQMKELYLSDNQLSGPLPTALGQLTQLATLFLSGNGFTGEIPPQLGDLPLLAHLILHGNQLQGPIPPTLGKLTNLRTLRLDNNALSGPLPVELGALTQLTHLKLHNNQLSGALPVELGNLRQLNEFTVAENAISGSLPPALGNLTELRLLDLHGNQFSGAVPPELGKLVNLRNFYLHNNGLRGALPLGMVNMRDLVEVKLDYNALYAPLPSLQELLDAKAPGWFATQTLAPTNLTAHQQSSSAIALTWTPTAYTLDGGFYEVGYATDPAGPFTVHGRTPSKRSNAYTVEGLTANTTYYFQLRSYTPAHHEQQNELWSDRTSVVSAATAAPGAGDAFEEDNTCAAARTLAVDGRLLDHTFHTPGDVDWLQVAVQPGRTYRIDVQIPAGSPVDVTLALYTDCAGEPVAQQNEPFSNGARLDYQPTQAGALWLKLVDQNGQAGSDLHTYRVAVRALGDETGAGAVILVAGRLSNGAPLQANLDTVADAAYSLFRSNGYSDENIRYLAGNGTRPGVDGGVTPELLRDAIVSWALDKVNPQRALTLYLVGNGEAGRFWLDEADGKVVTVADLTAWLTQLEESVPGVPINVIIDAPYAGSLINGEPTLSKPGRVILTATTATQRAFASRQGLHFSDHLLTALRQGQHLFGAYWETRTALFASHRSREGDLWQLPWIDANGNGVPNEVDDALQASLRSFGGATPVTSAVLWPPTLADVRIITNVLQATIADNRETPLRVWALLYPPDYTPPLSGAGFIAEDPAADPKLTLVELQPEGNGRYVAGLNLNGRYRFIVYAQDSEGLHARPAEVTAVMAPIVLNNRLYLPVVQR
jgi:Leucine-rich repeat (LRR) protein